MTGNFTPRLYRHLREKIVLQRISDSPGVCILRPKSTNPPPFPVLQTSPEPMFSRLFGAVFCTFRRKLYESYLFLDFLVSFRQFFVMACDFPFFLVIIIINFPLAYKIPTPLGGGGRLM